MKSPYNMGRCICEKPPRPAEAIKWLIDEVLEFLQHPCRDEAGDVSYHLGRAIYACTGITVVLPGAQAAINKGTHRFSEHGCVRSARNACNKE